VEQVGAVVGNTGGVMQHCSGASTKRKSSMYLFTAISERNTGSTEYAHGSSGATVLDQEIMEGGCYVGISSDGNVNLR
jgi:hypothetical protein